MKSLVIGYGSIGARHADVLRRLGCETAVVSRRDVDFRPRYRTVAEAMAAAPFEYAVIANRTSEHAGALDELVRRGFKGVVLVEKPLFCRWDAQRAARRRPNVFVAYNLRFHPLLQKLRSALLKEKTLSSHFYVGKYLPDWRPGDYRKSYSASAAQGGGVLRDLSHELDLALWLFGGWKSLAARGGHVSPLRIQSDDVFSLLIETPRCPIVSVQMNYLDRVLRREILVHTHRHSYRVDLARGEYERDGQTVERLPFDRNLTYRREHEAVMSRRYGTLCTFGEGLEVLRVIDAAEAASKSRRWVKR